MYEAGRQSTGKRIVAETVVQAPVDVVWRVLTNYERLADFVPNLESCERLPSQRAGKVRALPGPVRCATKVPSAWCLWTSGVCACS